MTTSRGKKTGRERQRITRTACEPCREKRAKCDGEQPCGRCQTRGLECHFIQRTWASKQSLQDEAASLRMKLQQRDHVIEALSVSGSGDEVVRMLRDGESCDEVYEKLGGGSSQQPDGHMEIKLDTDAHHDGAGLCGCQKCWSPTTASTDLSNASQNQSPFSFADSGSFPSNSPTHFSAMPQPTNPDQQNQSAAMQAIPWTAQDSGSFGNMMEPSMSTTLNMEGRPTMIDPLLWPPVMGSDPLGQPYMNSWTGLMGEAAAEHTKQPPFSGMA